MIDDDPTVRDLMSRFLTKEGFSVISAANGIDGLRRARETHPAAITLDVMMPDLDGWTVLAALKGDPSLADIPVILVTIVDEKARGYALGATDYMIKPIDRRRLVSEGTLERFTGDGMMIFFNDPLPVDRPAERALKMAVAMRDRVRSLSAGWRRRGHDLGLGVGVAEGYATIGAIGFEGRWDYGAIGTVTNLAARLCGEAKADQILVSPRVAGAVDRGIDLEPVGALTLKGFLKPVEAFNVRGLKPGA